MPNHVENDLNVVGSKEELLRFKEFSKDEKNALSAEKFIPYPKKFKEMDEKAKNREKKQELFKKQLVQCGDLEAVQKAARKFPRIMNGYNSGGYEWCVKNWGTKWGLYDVILIEENLDNLEKTKSNNLSYGFRTAWSPAVPIIRAMSRIFPLLTFELHYFERGAGYKGIYKVKNEIVIKDKIGNYSGHRGG